MEILSVESKKLLKRVVEYYRHSLSADSKGLIYLRDQLKVHHNLVIEDCKIGYSDGSLVDTLPEDPAVIASLTSLGILDKHGADKMKNCLVVPLTDVSGEIINLYTRNVKTHRSRFLRRSEGGFVNHRAFMAFECVIITPTVTDLSVLYDQGLQYCAYVYCGGNLEAGSFHFKSLKQVFITRFKAVGRRSCHKFLPAFFEQQQVAAHMLSFPTKSAATYFSKHYEIPEGVFRGALWPRPDNTNFQIWLIDGGKEIFYDIPAPSGFDEYEKETTEDWDFILLDSSNDRQIYMAKKKDNSKTVQIELPLKKESTV